MLLLAAGQPKKRTWLRWDPRGNATGPEIVRLVDPLPGSESGSTWTALGSTIDPARRTFTYLAVTAAEGPTVTGLSFVHVDVDTGVVRGATKWPLATATDAGLGMVFRFAVVPPSARQL